MKLPHRRQFLHLAAGTAALPAVTRIARAQAYPTRPVRIIVGFAPGGPQDILARLMGQWLSERLGQPFIVENRPGASSNIAAETVVHAPPDGYTLLLAGSANAVNASLYDKLNFNFIRDIAPVAAIMSAPLIMEISPSFPAKTVPEFIAYAKANPGKISIGSGGSGTSPNVSIELFKTMTGVNLTQVPYRGSAPMLTDLLGGQIQAALDPLVGSIAHIRAGKLRALAVTTVARSPALPEIPTVSEFVPGYEASTWYGIGAPIHTPAEIIDKLNSEINAGLADPHIEALLADQGGARLPGSPADFGRLIAGETEKWAKVVKAANRSQAVRSTAHILVGFPPGGTTDVIARLVASELKNYSSSVIVETRSGAAGRVALEALKSSAADGSVLSVAPLEGITLFPYIYKQLRYDGLLDFVPVTAVCAVPNLISVGPKVPVDVRTLADFVLWCRTNPKQATYGTPGAGTPLHFTGVLLARAAGFEFVHVPYQGGAPAVQDSLGGQIAATIVPFDTPLPHIQSGHLRALATTGPQRSTVLPDVPTVRECGYPALERVGWWGTFLPSKTPAEIVDKLNNATREALKTNEVKAGLATLSAEIRAISPRDFARLVKSEFEKWGPIVQASGFVPQD
jgi:tripartite-type tricarboxylate transporter receptor subunit TctC